MIGIHQKNQLIHLQKSSLLVVGPRLQIPNSSAWMRAGMCILSPKLCRFDLILFKSYLWINWIQVLYLKPATDPNKETPSHTHPERPKYPKLSSLNSADELEHCLDQPVIKVMNILAVYRLNFKLWDQDFVIKPTRIPHSNLQHYHPHVKGQHVGVLRQCQKFFPFYEGVWKDW